MKSSAFPLLPIRFSLQIRLAVLTFLSVLSFTACRRAATFDSSTLVTVYTPGYAEGFTIDSIPGMESTIITVDNPWQGAEGVVNRLFVARNGEHTPPGFDGQTVKSPIHRIAAMSSTHLAMLDTIGEINAVVAVSGLDYISNPSVRSRSHEVADIGFEGNVNYELLASLRPDIVLLYGVDSRSGMEGKLAELDIPYMYVGDYVEEWPLGKTEWLVAIAELFGKRDLATGLFRGIEIDYNSFSTYIRGQGIEPPRVMLNTPYGDSWFLPAKGSYMDRFIEDASGEYVFAANTSGRTMPVDAEQALMLASDATRWINVSDVATLDEFRRRYPQFANTPAVINGEIYANTLRSTPAGGNDFYESGVINPGLILRDLAKIMHPELFSDKEFYYYRKLE